MFFRLVLVVLVSSVEASASPPGACKPDPVIRAELQKAAVLQPNPVTFDQNIAPFLALRNRHPNDLFVHERYQDAVRQYGIEGHLRVLTQEYQDLSLEHSGDVMYRYLFARTLIGRSTTSAIQDLAQLAAERQDFAPAHRSLAEIYESETFHDGEKEKAEKERFLALCPGSVLTHYPAPLPGPSPLLEQAERLLAANGDPDRVAEMALQAIRDDEWRLQRIRAFDWYSTDYKRASQRELRSKYWQAWSIQVRCYRKANLPEKAAELVRSMEQRVAALNKDSDPSYWDALATLARLHAEGRQKEQATRELDAMRQFLAGHPDERRSKQLEELQKLIANSGA